MGSGEAQSWIELVRAFTADPEGTYECPSCGHARIASRLLIGQGPFLNDGDAEWHLWCEVCGKETYAPFQRKSDGWGRRSARSHVADKVEVRRISRSARSIPTSQIAGFADRALTR